MPAVSAVADHPNVVAEKRRFVTRSAALRWLLLAAGLLVAQWAFASPASAAEWEEQSSGTQNTLSGVSCPNTSTCYADGDLGTILATGNGGTTWNSKDSGTSNPLLSVSCPTSDICYAVGRFGTIRKTVDGGENWSGQSSATIDDLRDVSCPASATCYSVGSNGRIQKTSDGGDTWGLQTSGLGNLDHIDGVSCPTTAVCYAVGLSGDIRKTSDGGASWNPQSSGTSNNLREVSCPTTSTCYAVGESGTIRKTANGSTWTGLDSGTLLTLWGVSCPDTTTCYAVGSGGTIRKTTDGGATSWSGESSTLQSALLDVDCVNATHCWAVGNTGAIVTRDTTPPGKPTITTKPAKQSSDPSPTFTWVGAESGGSFECKLDTASFAACTSPKTYSDVPDGEHTFQVRQIDDAGNVGEAASYTWTINAVVSDDCDSADVVADGFAGTTYVKIRQAQPSPGETWICVHAANATANVGGKFVIDSSQAPGAPTVENDPDKCVPNGPIDNELGDENDPPHVKTRFNAYQTNGDVLVCAYAAETGTSQEFAKRVIVPIPDGGVVNSVRFEPDAVEADVPDTPPIPSIPSATCQDGEESGRGTYQRVVNISVTDPDQRIWLDTWQESDSRVHICVREEGMANAGGRITVDTQGLGVEPVLDTDDEDMTPCTTNVQNSEFLDTEIRRSGTGENPASICVRQGTTQMRVTAGTTGSLTPGVVTWTPDPGTPIPPLPPNL